MSTKYSHIKIISSRGLQLLLSIIKIRTFLCLSLRLLSPAVPPHHRNQQTPRQHWPFLKVTLTTRVNTVVLASKVPFAAFQKSNQRTNYGIFKGHKTRIISELSRSFLLERFRFFSFIFRKLNSQFV